VLWPFIALGYGTPPQRQTGASWRPSKLRNDRLRRG
jgi:hypothetical protein